VAFAAALLVMPVAPALAAPPAPFGHACTPQASTLFCPTTTDAQRVASFDGTPIDVDVTLPATGDGPFPTVVMLHGFGGSKTGFQSTDPNARQRFNSTALAQRGYAVVTPSIRGFGRSCGASDSRTPDCASGYIRLADQRYEARDIQALLGRLVDQRVADPARLGVTGESYGGGISMSLAYLKDRVRLPDGSYAAWRSPGGTALSLAAAAPIIPWSDIASALVPNGRFRDTGTAQQGSRTPAGVPIGRFLDLLYASAQGSGYVAPAGLNPAADLAGWKARLDRGEPYGADVGRILAELFEHHSALGVGRGTPAPLHIAQGWTDDLFPVDQALRAYNGLRAADRRAEVTLELGDFGHPRATNPPAVLSARNARITTFLDDRLRKNAGRSAAGSVTATLTECRAGAAPTTVHARSYAALHPGQLLLPGSGGFQPIRSSGGDKSVGQALGPVGGAASGACDRVAYRRAPAAGTAQYLARVRRPVTLLGSPAVAARVRARGASGQVVARLWDVDRASRRQRLVARGVYRLTRDQRGSVRFQLNANGYRFAAGHSIKLELLGRDAPSYRPSRTAFSVQVRLTALQIPTRERASTARGTSRFGALR